MKTPLSLTLLLMACPLLGQAVGGGGVPGVGTTGSLPNAPAAGYAPVSTAPGTSSYSASPVVANLFPGNIQLTVDGASVTAGYNAENDTYILSQSGGSGYSGTGTVTVSGGTCATTPTISAVVEPNSASSTTGPLVFSQTVIGYCSSSPTSCTPTGFTGGSGASCTVSHYANPYPNAWPTLLTTESALNGKVASFTNNAVNSAVIAGVTNSVSSRFTSLGYATTCASGSYNEYFLLGGDAAQNAIYNNGGGTAGAATAYAQWIALAHAIKAAGCKLIVTTPNTRGTSSNVNDIPNQALLTGINAFSSLLRNGVAGVDYDYIIDFGALIQDTSDPNFYDQIDFQHPIAGGHQMMADVANAALVTGGAPHAILAPWLNPVWGGNGYFYGSLGTAGQISTAFSPTTTTSAVHTTGGAVTGSSTPPAIYWDCGGATQPTSWDSNGVWMGFNLCSGFSANGDIIEAHQNGGNQLFAISALGAYYGTGFSGTSANGFGWSGGTSVGSNRDTTLCRGGATGIVSVESAATCTNTVAGATGTLAYAVQAPGILYSSAGTPVPTCGSGTKGYNYIVSDATTPTYMGTYTPTATNGVTTEVICSFNGTTYSLFTH